MALKTPSENQHWPAFFYPPETDPENPGASGRLCQSADDVPDGWAHHWSEHGQDLNREPPPAPDIEMTRRQIIAELVARDIAAPPQAAKAELWRLLQEAQEAERLDESV